MKKFPLWTASLFLLGIPPLIAQTPVGGADITYSLPRAAKVSLNVLNSKGWIVRELLRADPEDAGSRTVHWDGNDQLGHPMPSGEYLWKILHHTGFKADYVLSVGNSGQPPYRTDDDKGSWGACHGNPLSIQADDTGLYIAWYVEEGNATFAHTDYDGRHIFKIHSAQGWGRNYGCALAGGMIYRLECGAIGSYIEKYAAADGKYVPWQAKNSQISGGKLRIEKESRVVPDKKAPKDPNALPSDYADGMAIAANDRYIVVSFPNLNKLAIFRPTGEQLEDLAIDQPHGLLFLPDGRLLVAQQKKISAVQLDQRSVQPFFTKDLVSPWGMALARDGRSLWITDQGVLSRISNISEWTLEPECSYQVKQFDMSGKLLSAIGKPGGMPSEGTIDQQSFFRPHGIACGTDGNLYVTEDSPLRRISRWTPGGKLLREWFGPVGPQRSCWPNLSNFSEIYYHSSNEGIIQCKVDLQKKTWYPVAWSQTHIVKGQPYVFESHGRKFLYDSGSTLFAWDAKAETWKPALKFKTIGKGGEKERKVALWTDLNSNGQEDEGEMQTLSIEEFKTKNQLNPGLSFAHFDPATMVLHGVMGSDVIKVFPTEFTAQGLPVYQLDQFKRLTPQPARNADGVAGWADQMIYNTHGVFPTADGGFLTAYNGGRQGATRAWDRANWNRLVRFGPDGRIQWQVGLHAMNRTANHPADMSLIMRMTSPHKGVVLLADTEPAQFQAYTEDGLYVDALMNTGNALSPNSLTVENITGLVAEDPATHESYLFSGSTEDARIWRLSGYDSFQRMEGKVTLKTAEIPVSTSSGTYTIAATKPPRPRIANDFGADGFLNEPEWQQAKELPLVDNGALVGRIYLRQDGQYLWIGAQIIDPSPAQNASQDPETAFTRGDCVDLYFGANPAADASRKTADVGDVRVLLYPAEPDPKSLMYNGRIVAYRMKTPPGAEKHPFEFASPVSSVTADSVTPIEGKDTVTNGGLCSFYRWPNGTGYTAEAKIPLSALPELGLGDPSPSPHKIAFDAGVIFSNNAGNDRASRLYWRQMDSNTQTVQDLPTEAQFYPQLWGSAQIETAVIPGR